jgi:hypothetical protein
MSSDRSIATWNALCKSPNLKPGPMRSRILAIDGLYPEQLRIDARRNGIDDSGIPLEIKWRLAEALADDLDAYLPEKAQKSIARPAGVCLFCEISVELDGSASDLRELAADLVELARQTKLLEGTGWEIDTSNDSTYLQVFARLPGGDLAAAEQAFEALALDREDWSITIEAEVPPL